MEAQERWHRVWSQLGVEPRGGLLADVLGAYAEPQRCYHTLQHLEECFAALDPAAHLALRGAEVELAVWFHDAVYDTHAADNEQRSAAWADLELREGGAGPEAAARVGALVLATRHEAPPSDPDARLLVDVDLSILGAGEPRYTEYERQIRGEYAWVPDELFRPGRARILTRFLERPSIYSTTWFAGRLEARARRNLSRSLKRLVD